jgi:hypothetical protein
MKPLPPPCPLPFLNGGADPLRMGLQAIAPAAWFEPDESRERDLAEKRRLLAERRAAVLAVRPEGEAPSRELRDRLVDHLERTAPDLLGQALTRLQGEGPRHPLESAALMVQDDLCLLDGAGDGAPVLVAACVCFPTRWRLADKIGRPLDAIHAPVPGLEARIGRSIDAFFRLLAPGKVYQRFNWGVTDDPALHQPEARLPVALAEGEIGRRLFLRVERQTLARLPESRAFVFTIRVHQRPLGEIRARPGAARGLLEAVEALPPALLAYKGLAPYAPALKRWLSMPA